MKRFSIAIILLGLVFLTSCKLQKEGLVIMTDASYKASMFATSKTGFGSPDGLLWRNGKLYLANEGSDALEVWSKADGLKRLADAKLGFLSPEDLVMDKDGNIFFTDDDAGGLWEVDALGGTHLIAGKDKGLISTEGIALAADGSLLVGDGEQHEVFRVTRDGKVAEFLGKEYGITKPESMVFDDKGNLYIADNAFSPETIYFFKGSLYITDSHNGKLYVYTPNEEVKTIAAFGGQLKNVQGITLDDQGNIFVSVQSDLKRDVGEIIEISKENAQIAQR